MPITPFEAQMLIARCEQAKAKSKATAIGEGLPPDPGPERDLHSKILDECRRRGWLAFHGSMAHKTKRTKGESDFSCLLPGGRVLFVECKSKTGKLSPDQLATLHHMKKLGHIMHVVRSMKEFNVLCDALLKSATASEGSKSYPILKTEDG